MLFETVRAITPVESCKTLRNVIRSGISTITLSVMKFSFLSYGFNECCSWNPAKFARWIEFVVPPESKWQLLVPLSSGLRAPNQERRLFHSLFESSRGEGHGEN